MPVKLKRHTITVEDYLQMFQVGILSESDKVELINGEIFSMSPVGSRHIYYVNQLNHLFHALLGNKAVVSIQNPFKLDSHSEPEPDIALLKPPKGVYKDRHAESSDILLIGEVAEPSIDYDREVKVPLYAKVGVSIVWLLDIDQGQLEVYEVPKNGQYTSKQIYFSGDVFTLEISGEEFSISVSEILE
ncbi:MAG: Uma2 family endonuclease [Bacteroidota bacterium]